MQTWCARALGTGRTGPRALGPGPWAHGHTHKAILDRDQVLSHIVLSQT